MLKKRKRTMYLTRHQTTQGARLALDGAYLPRYLTLQMLLDLPLDSIGKVIQSLPTEDAADGLLLPPLEPMHEVWACGVTYLRSREARELESDAKDVYEKVYKADRPELFFKAIGWRVVGHNMPVRIRQDSRWNVPEPELTLVINIHREIVGFRVGNDVSSRDIEGANPLYLPQAKMYNGACALGPGIKIAGVDELRDLDIQIDILREERIIYHDETRSSQMKRSLEELVNFLTREMDFPYGVFLMTGTGIVPDDEFSLQVGDLVRIRIGSLTMENVVNS
jgi:2-dehydro-3-deoxy-D-arabinonate dehydratase